MKSTLTFIALLAWACPLQAYCQTQSIVLFKADSIPAQQMASLSKERYKFGSGSADNQATKHLVTLVVQSSRKQDGREIMLPIGVDLRTVAVTSGELTLHLDKDYVFVPNTNRLRVVNEAILRSDQAVRVTYERSNFTP